MKLMRLLASCALGVLCLVTISHANSQPYLILSAVKLEYLPIAKHMTDTKEGVVAHIHYLEGNLHHLPVVVAYTGVGNLNAAFVTGLFIHRFHPRGVIYAGSAGGLRSDLKVGDVVVSTSQFSLDNISYVLDKTQFSMGELVLFPDNQVTSKQEPLEYFSSQYYIHLLKKSHQDKQRVFYAPIVTANTMIDPSDNIKKLLIKNGVLAIAMEDVGVAHVCWMYGVPMISIRGISNNILLRTPFTEETAAAASNAAAHVVGDLLEGLKCRTRAIVSVCNG